MQIQAVRVSDIDRHITELIQSGRLSASSIEKVVDVLNAAYQWAVMCGELNENPVAPLKPTLVKRLQKMRQKTAKEADALSAEEEKIFCKEALRLDEKTENYKYPAGPDNVRRRS